MFIIIVILIAILIILVVLGTAVTRPCSILSRTKWEERSAFRGFYRVLIGNISSCSGQACQPNTNSAVLPTNDCRRRNFCLFTGAKGTSGARSLERRFSSLKRKHFLACPVLFNFNFSSFAHFIAFSHFESPTCDESTALGSLRATLPEKSAIMTPQ